MKTLVSMTFALILGAFMFGIAGQSNASPAATAAVSTVQAEAVKTDVTEVNGYRGRWGGRYRRWGGRWGCRTRCYTRCWRPRPVCNPCCGGGRLGFLFF